MKKTILIISAILIVILLVVAVSIAPKTTSQENMLNIKYDVKGNVAKLDYDTENPVVAMYVENYGSIVMELYPDIAPNTVNNFIKCF